MERGSAGYARKCRRHGQANRGKSDNAPANHDRSGGFEDVSKIRPGARRRVEEPDFILRQALRCDARCPEEDRRRGVQPFPDVSPPRRMPSRANDRVPATVTPRSSEEVVMT